MAVVAGRLSCGGLFPSPWLPITKATITSWKGDGRDLTDGQKDDVRCGAASRFKRKYCIFAGESGILLPVASFGKWFPHLVSSLGGFCVFGFTACNI
jgi:hypothetical protein